MEELNTLNDVFYTSEERRVNDRLSLDLNSHLISMNLKKDTEK